MKKTLVLASALFVGLSMIDVHAQTDLDIEALAAIVRIPYAGLDSSKVSTGYLADKAVDLVKLPLFDGAALCDSNYVDIATFRDLFRTMNYAKVNGTASVYDADSIYGTLSSSAYIKLGSSLFQYNRIRGDAITGGLIEYNTSNGTFSDRYVGGVWQNPYETDYAFMFTAGKQASGSLEVLYDISDLTSWGNSNVASVLIDYGNGGGYVSPGAFSVQQVIYSSSGTKELKLKVTLQNSVVLESHTRVFVSSQQSATSGAPADVADSTFTVSAGGVSALCSVKYAYGHGGKAVKPFIYVEGFDHPVLCELSRKTEGTYLEKLAGLKENLHNILVNNCQGNYSFHTVDSTVVFDCGYDLFYVDWNNPEADINLNARLLKDVIRTVNACKPSDGNGERTVITGHSMGGLVARVALRQMELDGEAHQVGCFVSQDVPQYGANVPIGVQYTIRDIYRFFFGPGGNSGLCLIPDVKTVVDRVVGVLDCTAARQMMYNYVDSSGNIDNTVHQQWQNYLTSIGFPRGDVCHPIENLTIVSGNSLDASDLSQQILSFGLFFVNLKSLFETPFPTTFSIDAQIDRDRQAGTLVSKTTIAYTVYSQVLKQGLVIPLMVHEHYSPSGIGHYDTVPGSFLEFYNPGSSLLFNNPFLYLTVGEKAVFVPTASSFAVENYNANFYNDFSSYESSSPFNSFCLEKYAAKHDEPLSNYMEWIQDFDDIRIGCPEVVFSGDMVSIAYKPYSHIDDEVVSFPLPTATINNGQITVANPGLFTITYKTRRSDGNQDHYFRKRRRVLAGFPDMTLTTSKVSGDQYMVTASLVSNDSELQAKMNELTGSGEIRYIWGVKNSDNSYNWSDTTSVNYHYVTVQSGSKVNICFKMYNGPGRESGPQVATIDRSSNINIFYDPHEILVDNMGYSMNYLKVSGLSSYNYLAIWCNPEYSGTSIAPDTVQIGLNTYPVETSFSQVIDGHQVTVYCFDIIDDPDVQANIAAAMNGFQFACVPFVVYGSGVMLKHPVIPVVSTINQ